MKRNVNSPAPRSQPRHVAEIYCRRDNRVYPTCPHVDDMESCPCLMGLETADSLFEPKGDEEEAFQ